MWGEGELMDPGQDNVLRGLRHKHSEDCQNTRHPQLNCSYRCLEGWKDKGGANNSSNVRVLKSSYFGN